MDSIPHHQLWQPRHGALALLAALTLSCGSGPGGGPAQSLSIVTQPASQSVPLDQTATFTVVASGAAPLIYQWSNNGTAIAGATGASYMTPAVTAADSGSTFTVTVADRSGSVVSNAATLTVGPRSPLPGDLRFQLVDSPAEADQLTGSGVAPGLSGAQELFFSNGTGYPLSIGDGGSCVPNSSPENCVWLITEMPLPAGQSGLNAYYESGVYANFSSDLNSNFVTQYEPANAPNNVILSLDLEPAYNAYAMAWMQTTQGGGFDMKREIVAPNAVAATVAADAAASRVVTAVSFDANGQANLLSYGWQGDATTVYDTSVIVAAGADVVTDGESLAGEGYILTAFGGDVTDGFVLVGTKVHGDSMPRPVLIDVLFANGAFTSGGYPRGTFAGYAPVASLLYLNPDGTTAGEDFIFEK